jgi:hypothetical protein
VLLDLVGFVLFFLLVIWRKFRERRDEERSSERDGENVYLVGSFRQGDAGAGKRDQGAAGRP